jgi:hypothetical protein
LDADFNEQSSRSKLKSPKIEPINTQPSNLSNSIINSPSIRKQRLDSETKSNTNLDKSIDIPSKESNKGKHVSSSLPAIDQVSQQSKSSVSFKNYNQAKL